MDPQLEFSNAKMAMDSILDAIRIGDKEDIVKYLGTIALEYIPAEEQVLLLDVLLHQVYTFGESSFVDLLFNYFDDVNSTSTNIPTLSLYLMRSGLKEHILSFIGSTITATFELTVQGINAAPISPLSYEGCVNAEKVFGKPSYETLLKLDNYLFTDPQDLNKYIYKYVKRETSELEPVKDKPSWIVNGAEDDSIPLQSDLDIPKYPDVSIMSPDEFTELAIKEMINQGVEEVEHDDKFAYQMLASHYAISTLEHKLIRVNDYNENVLLKQSVNATYKPIVVDTKNDDILFLIYGPNNTSFDQKVEPIPDGTVCERYGGCRMLLCNCSEAENNHDDGDIQDYDEFGVPDVDWYTGKCQECGGGIEFRHYAIRKPLKMGGWVGCFCGIECIQKNMKYSDMIVTTLIERMSVYLNDKGIQDRRYSDKNQNINTD